MFRFDCDFLGCHVMPDMLEYLIADENFTGARSGTVPRRDVCFCTYEGELQAIGVPDESVK
jgi:hypothetical protein